jgi:uncharacterized membrane protein YvlD (DUF360 family)
MRLLLTWLINAAALMALPYLMHSVTITHVGSALVAALVLGLVNTLIRPVLVVLTLPVTLVSLGLFILVINALAVLAGRAPGRGLPCGRILVGLPGGDPVQRDFVGTLHLTPE